MEMEEGEEKRGKTKMGKRKSSMVEEMGEAGQDDIDAKFDRLLAISAEVRSAEARATQALLAWRTKDAAGGGGGDQYSDMSAALREWQFWTSEKDRILNTQLRPLAREIVEFYKREIEEDALRVIDDDDDDPEDEGEAATSAPTPDGAVDDLAMSLAEVLSLVERARLAKDKQEHRSPAKRRRQLEEERERSPAEDQTDHPTL